MKLRGSGIKGTPWYVNGKLLNKMNTFNDFIACAGRCTFDVFKFILEYFIKTRWTTPNQLAINGRSAGYSNAL